MPGTECDGGKDCGREIGKMEALGEERMGAKERVENRKEKRSFFIKSCTKKGAKSRFFVTNNVKNVTF